MKGCRGRQRTRNHQHEGQVGPANAAGQMVELGFLVPFVTARGLLHAYQFTWWTQMPARGELSQEVLRASHNHIPCPMLCTKLCTQMFLHANQCCKRCAKYAVVRVAFVVKIYINKLGPHPETEIGGPGTLTVERILQVPCRSA